METVGSLIDKLSINELKIYHMKEQAERTDVDKNFLEECENRLKILQMQRGDLSAELDDLIVDIAAGKKDLKLFRQMKMYNEKKYRD